MKLTDRIYVAGHNGLVGGGIHRLLKSLGYTNIITRTSRELDLRDQQAVASFFEKEKPQFVFMSAAKVGGIWANKTYPAEFIYDNLMIQNNVIHQAYLNKVEKLLFLGSSCIYPKNAPQPIVEDYLLKDYLEPTNEAYAIAKIAGIKLCQFYAQQYGVKFISAMPTNLYGPGDNYDLQNSHVLPALIRKFHEAKLQQLDSVVVWGTGSPKREFLHVDDMASACYYLMQNYDGVDFVNVGWGKDNSIAEMANLIKEITGFKGEIIFDTTKPDGTPRKLLSVDRINQLGWKATIDLQEGLAHTYEDFCSNYDFYVNRKKH